MSQKFSTSKPPVEAVVRDIRRATRRHYSAEDKIRIVLEGLRGEQSIAELCRREGIAVSMYYSWSKEFLEAGKRRLAVRVGPRHCRIAPRGPIGCGTGSVTMCGPKSSSWPWSSQNSARVSWP
jgi:hypothetical protein